MDDEFRHMQLMSTLNSIVGSLSQIADEMTMARQERQELRSQQQAGQKRQQEMDETCASQPIAKRLPSLNQRIKPKW